MYRCPESASLHQLLDGDSDGLDSAALEMHVASCSVCRDSLEAHPRFRRLQQLNTWVRLQSGPLEETIRIGDFTAELIRTPALLGLELADRWDELWNSSNQSPDLDRFLEDHRVTHPVVRLVILLRDQEHRWRTDRPYTVEDYLARWPDLAGEEWFPLRLLLGEYEARRSRGPLPEIGEFVSRFPEFGDELRRRLQVLSTYENVDPSAEAELMLATFPGNPTLGRYRLVRDLGQGGFGQVWLAFDEELQRHVAIKIPHADRFADQQQAAAFLKEAQAAAMLDDPRIVPVYDVGRTQDGTPYVVSKYIRGCTLAQLLRDDPPAIERSVELVAEVARALDHAHRRGLVHRDVKPANILIDARTGQPHVADFGLAIREDDSLPKREIAGTPSYMSPEQVRGEGHRLCGRSDLFSLGVILYELLTGHKPFRGASPEETRELVAAAQPLPPRAVHPAVPEELERICLKALSKRISDRYACGAELADDLQQWSVQPRRSEHTPTIFPRGLRSFDAEDADSFLEILPGPRDREGLPLSLRFWKQRIESTDPETTFSVGIIYGPSGCGKTSLVKAGLLPRLSEQVVAVYVESTASDSEVRILAGLRKRVPELPEELGLVEAFAWLRRTARRKVVVILDQFEQWLHAHQGESDAELVGALRQCDGGRVQAVVMIRDDFGMAGTRFMDALDIPILQGHNFATVDLFEIEHAEKVLTRFGQAFGKLPEDWMRITDRQREFVSSIVARLAQDGRVISVHLALVAEMVKNKPWVPETLKEVGGTDGIGVHFLEEAFRSRSANPLHQKHQQAARRVLKALLPDVGTDIKGHMRSEAELLEASGYQQAPGEFAVLRRILDGELRLMTPTDALQNDLATGQRYYQLTHDYLVAPLREWITRQQAETRRGRAELRLAERVALWDVQPENRFLPSFGEWAAILAFTDRKSWTTRQTEMMDLSGRRFLSMAGLGLFLFLTMALTGVGLRRAVVAEQQRIRKQQQEEQRAAEASRLVDSLLNAETSRVGAIIDELAEYRSWADARLARDFGEAEMGTNARLHSALALLPDEGALAVTGEHLLASMFPQFSHLRDFLRPHAPALLEGYREIAVSQDEQPSRRLRAAGALADFDPQGKQWSDPDLLRFVAFQLTHAVPSELVPWRETFRGVRNQLITPLAGIYRDAASGELVRSFAADILADYLADHPAQLFDLLADADESRFPVLFDRLRGHRARAIELAETEMQRREATGSDPVASEARAIRRANAAVLLLKLNSPDAVWPLFGRGADVQTRSELIHKLAPLEVGSHLVLDRLQEETDPVLRQALLLCLGEFDDGQLSPAVRSTLVPGFLALLQSDPHAGVHAAAAWLLKRWGKSNSVAVVIDQLKQPSVPMFDQDFGTPGWYVNSQGQTFVVLEGGEFRMGSPSEEQSRQPDEFPSLGKVGHRFAISSKEVTREQFLKFRPDWTYSQAHRYPDPDCPIGGISWYEAAEYCNWLSGQEGIPPDQWCFEPNERGQYADGMRVRPNFSDLSGYRLPTEVEWEYACRAGTATSRNYGSSDRLLNRYAWYQSNAGEVTWPVGSLKPNEFGLFDMHGNVMEWCIDPYLDYNPDSHQERSADVTPDGLVIHDAVSRVVRGGAFLNVAALQRSAFRALQRPPTSRVPTDGFRPARTVP